MEITPQAEKELKKYKEGKEGNFIRIYTRGIGWGGKIQFGMSLEETKKEQDHEIKLPDLSLILDNETNQKMEGKVLDYQDMRFGIYNK